MKLTHVQRRFLAWLCAGGRGLPSWPVHGSTLKALYDRRLIKRGDLQEWRITNAGRAALKKG